MTILEKIERNARIEELEEALTDALYAWGMVTSICTTSVSAWGSIAEMQDYKEAEERIQRARLALPKDHLVAYGTGTFKPGKSTGFKNSAE